MMARFPFPAALLCALSSAWLGCSEGSIRVAWTVCEPGWFVAREGTKSADRTCEPCADGTYSSGQNAAACVEWAVCEPGWFVAEDGAAPSDRVCAACERGTFSSEANAAACDAWTVCEPGTFVSGEGSATGDQTCAACPDGTLSLSANQSACTPVGACAAGTVQVAPATASTAPVCETCEAGTHCAGGTSPQESCEDGTWDHDASPATECVAWAVCVAGQYVAQDGTATSERVCAACQGASFSSSANAAACSAWTTCEPGSFVALTGSTTRDQECAACPAGTLSQSANQSACTPVGECAAGTVQLAPATASTPPVCETCEVGTYCAGGTSPRKNCENGRWDHDANPATACVAWTDCEPGQYASTQPSATTGRGCRACDVGHSSTERNASSCFAVPAAFSGGNHTTCALIGDGRVKCWGRNQYGQLGYGDTDARGDGPGEMGNALPAVDLGPGRTAKAIAVGSMHVCALLGDGRVKCWGGSPAGQLGQGDTASRGDGPGEMGDALPAVDLGTGRTARALAAGAFHTCALLDDGRVKCWGHNTYGQLGLGDKSNRGDGPGEMGDALAAVDLGTGRTATAIAASNFLSCALLDDASVKCWGDNSTGQLGLGDTQHRGDGPGEMGDALPAVDLGTGRRAKAVTVNWRHTCALLDNATVKCWGDNPSGQLGLGDTRPRGDGPGEMGDALPAVDLGTGRTARAVSAGRNYTCALLNDGRVKCWGWNDRGQLGLGDSTHRGGRAGEMGDALPAVDLGTGRTTTALAAWDFHSCARLDDGRLKCWGWNDGAALGLGDTEDRGGGPGQMGDALPAVDLGSRP